MDLSESRVSLTVSAGYAAVFMPKDKHGKTVEDPAKWFASYFPPPSVTKISERECTVVSQTISQ